jgi:hypothetical protein
MRAALQHQAKQFAEGNSLFSRTQGQHRTRLFRQSQLHFEGELPARAAVPAPTQQRQIADIDAWAADAVRTVWTRAARAGAVELLLCARFLL